MSKRAIVIVLDGFGIGEMVDVKEKHPNDVGANTALHILKKNPNIKIPTLLQLGLMNALGQEINNFMYSPMAVVSKVNVMHFGADSFWGHQEIMGIRPLRPFIKPFSFYIEQVEKELQQQNYKVERIQKDNLEILVINECISIGDNLESDPGTVYNVTGCLDTCSFQDIQDVARIVRKIVAVSRVIAFGGLGINKENLVQAIRINKDIYIGVDAPKSGVYNHGYQVIHLGYGVNPKNQLQSLVAKAGIPVYLLGKFADVIELENCERYPNVETDALFVDLLSLLKQKDNGLFCLNIQQTDLAGHAQDVQRYAKVLEKCDVYLEQVLNILTKDDLLIVTADHGNDPMIGHSNHTREKVPILIKYNNVTNVIMEERDTLSDIAATISSYLHIEKPENGESFYAKLHNIKN